MGWTQGSNPGNDGEDILMKTSMGVENMKKQNLVIGWIKRHKSLLVMSFTALSFLEVCRRGRL